MVQYRNTANSNVPLNTGRPGTSSTQGKLQRNAAKQLTIAGKPKPKLSTGFKRVVFLAHFEDQEIVKTHTAHLRLKPEDCNVNDVAKLVKDPQGVSLK